MAQKKSCGREWGCNRPCAGAVAYWPSLILFTGLQIADVITTNCALAMPGNWEANPIMKLSQMASFGGCLKSRRLASQPSSRRVRNDGGRCSLPFHITLLSYWATWPASDRPDPRWIGHATRIH